MNRKAILRRCRQKLRSVHFPSGALDLRGLANAIGASCGRRIHLETTDAPASSPSGAVLARADMAVIMYPSHALGTYQNNVVAHELAHLLLDHHPRLTGFGPLRLVDDELVDSMLFCRTNFALPVQAGGHADYSEDQEAEAEIMAWLLVEKLRDSRTRQPHGPLTAALMPAPADHDVANGRRWWQR